MVLLAPSAEMKLGSRTGKYPLGGDDLLVDANGKSHISLEDFAAAMIDEMDILRMYATVSRSDIEPCMTCSPPACRTSLSFFVQFSF